jgi:hypothetical protein
LGAIFVQTIEDEKDNRGEYTGREGRKSRSKEDFEPDVSLRVRKACSERGCPNYSKVLSAAQGCSPNHYVGHLVIRQSKTNLLGSYYDSEYFITCLKNLLQEGMIEFPRLWKSMGNIIRSFAIRRGYSLKGCEGESVMMSDSLRRTVRMYGKPLLPMKLKDDIDVFRFNVKERFLVSQFARMITSEFDKMNCSGDLEVGLRLASIWRFDQLLVIYEEKDILYIFLLLILCNYTKRVRLILTYGDFPYNEISDCFSFYKEKIKNDRLAIPLKWRSYIDTYIKSNIRGNVVYFIKMSVVVQLNRQVSSSPQVTKGAGSSKQGPAADNGVGNETAGGGTHASTRGREATSSETQMTAQQKKARTINIATLGEEELLNMVHSYITNMVTFANNTRNVHKELKETLAKTSLLMTQFRKVRDANANEEPSIKSPSAKGVSSTNKNPESMETKMINAIEELKGAVETQGEEIRAMKASKDYS